MLLILLFVSQLRTKVIDHQFIFGEKNAKYREDRGSKTVPSRPFTGHRSSKLLAGAINSSPQNSITETTSVIKPKTVRFKTYVKSSPDASNFSQELHGSHQKTFEGARSKHQVTNHVPYLVQSPSFTSGKEIYEHSDLASPNMKQLDTKAQLPNNNGDRPSFDGYNWRKYGQKEVKGSKYLRSYYKCTHPSCPMKKQVEKSFDGQIEQIVYNRVHSHPKPLPPKGLGSGSEEQNSYPYKIVGSSQNSTTEDFSGEGILGTSHDLSVGSDVGNRTCGIDNDRQKPKRRKIKDQVSREGTTSQCISDTEFMMQTCTESHVTGDGFRWRKYGQKIVKGNSYPRSYYKCTNPKCNARKHIERASDDPRSFVTTYEGKHNHEMRDKMMNSIASDSDTPYPDIF